MKCERKVHGVCSENAFGGLEISLSEDLESVFWRDNYGKPGKWHKVKIRVSEKENELMYFIAGGRKVFLDEVMRV